MNIILVFVKGGAVETAGIGDAYALVIDWDNLNDHSTTKTEIVSIMDTLGGLPSTPVVTKTLADLRVLLQKKEEQILQDQYDSFQGECLS